MRHKNPSQRYLLTLEYIGTSFAGWQKQPHHTGLKTVQGALEAACSRLLNTPPSKKKASNAQHLASRGHATDGEPIRVEDDPTGQGMDGDASGNEVPAAVYVVGSSRTDTGVHALGSTCHVDIQRRSMRDPSKQLPPFSPLQLTRGLNHFLQEAGADVSVVAAQPVPADFHARFNATERTYLYRICAGPPSPSIFEANRAWHIPRHLDVTAMREAAAILIGRHDFSSFRASGCQALSPVKTLTELSVFEVQRWQIALPAEPTTAPCVPASTVDQSDATAAVTTTTATYTPVTATAAPVTATDATATTTATAATASTTCSSATVLLEPSAFAVPHQQGGVDLRAAASGYVAGSYSARGNSQGKTSADLGLPDPTSEQIRADVCLHVGKAEAGNRANMASPRVNGNCCRGEMPGEHGRDTRASVPDLEGNDDGGRRTGGAHAAVESTGWDGDGDRRLAKRKRQNGELGVLSLPVQSAAGGDSDSDVQCLVIRARAPSFLYRQVRLLVGVLKAVGVGQIPVAKVQQILDAKDVRSAPSLAPAYGLYLTHVAYEGLGTKASKEHTDHLS